MSLQAAALKYARAGLAVFPCAPREKVPRQGSHGFKDASTDPNVVGPWWESEPEANVALATGTASGVVVLDIDPRNGGDASLAELLTLHGSLPETRMVATPTGGTHYWFRSPEGGLPTRAALLAGIDLKADGGYVIVPPSIHPQGGAYSFANQARVAPLPDWLRLLAQPPRTDRTPPSPAVPDERLDDSWAGKALLAEYDGVLRAPEGQRNMALNKAAFNLGQIVGGGQLVRSVAEDSLRRAAIACGLPDNEAQGTIRSGLEAGIKEPRKRPRRDPPSLTLVRTPSTNGIEVAPNATDLGNAARFAAQHHGQARYCHAWKTWLVWDGKRWARDRDGRAVRLAVETVRELYVEASSSASEDGRKMLARHAMRSEGNARIAAMLELAQSSIQIATTPESFDPPSTARLFNARNGIVDLERGELLPHSPDYMLTRVSPADFRPEACSKLWDSFLARVLPDPEVRTFLQRFAGYSLTADTSEQVFALLYGTGANGKSTFLETLSAVMDDYAHKADFDTFLESARGKDHKGTARPDIVALAGKRLVLAVEAGAGRRIDGETVKAITGSDTITARTLYTEPVSFRPQAKVMLAANHKPEVPDSTEAMWRRLLEVPFTVTIPKSERVRDLPDMLRSPDHLTACLAWMFHGCRAWLASGLNPPDAVQRATSAYRGEQDILAPFLEACCVCEPSAKVTKSDLRSAYKKWCQEADEQPVSDVMFARRMAEHGISSERSRTTSRTKVWVGVRLLDSSAAEQLAADI